MLAIHSGLPVDSVLLGDCRAALPPLPSASVDFCLTDPPYLCNYRDRSGRTLAGDRVGDWLEPAFAEVYRLLKPNTVCVSFYGWHKVDAFVAAWRAAGFRLAGHLLSFFRAALMICRDMPISSPSSVCERLSSGPI